MLHGVGGSLTGTALHTALADLGPGSRDRTPAAGGSEPPGCQSPGRMFQTEAHSARSSLVQGGGVTQTDLKKKAGSSTGKT